MIFLNLSTQNTIETKNNHLASTSTSWNEVPPVFDVMTWRHDVTSSYKYKTDNIFELSNPKFHRNKKIIIFLAHLQAEIRKKVWVRHAVTSWRHVMAWKHHASTYTIIAWNPAIEIITEIHMYHHFRTSTSWYRRSEFCDIMTSRHDVMTSCKHKSDNIFELGKPENYRNKKQNHLSSTSTTWDRVSPVFDVMTWRHDVTSSCKYKTDNIFELSNPKFHRNKKRIIFLAHLQAEIGKISLGASCCDVMTSQCHAVELNQNLSTVSCEWDLGLWKNGTFSWSKNFLI